MIARIVFVSAGILVLLGVIMAALMGIPSAFLMLPTRLLLVILGTRRKPARQESEEKRFRRRLRRLRLYMRGKSLE